MKAYFSALIDKSVPSENSKLAKNLIKYLKKHLKTPESNISFKEHAKRHLLARLNKFAIIFDIAGPP